MPHLVNVSRHWPKLCNMLPNSADIVEHRAKLCQQQRDLSQIGRAGAMPSPFPGILVALGNYPKFLCGSYENWLTLVGRTGPLARPFSGNVAAPEERPIPHLALVKSGPVWPPAGIRPFRGHFPAPRAKTSCINWCSRRQTREGVKVAFLTRLDFAALPNYQILCSEVARRQ